MEQFDKDRARRGRTDYQAKSAETYKCFIPQSFLLNGGHSTRATTTREEYVSQFTSVFETLVAINCFCDLYRPIVVQPTTIKSTVASCKTKNAESNPDSCILVELSRFGG